MSELRVGLVGCGAIGRDHVRRINEVIQNAKITAVSDVFVEGGQKVADQWGCAFFADGCEMIRSDLVDAVVVTTLDQYHDMYVLEAIKCGKYVFCEKPLAPTADACRKIMDAEIAGGRQLVQVGFMRRYDTGYRALKKIVDEKVYGEPLLLHCRHRNPMQPDYYETTMLATNCAVHEIDVLRWLLNEDYVRCEVLCGKQTRHSPAKLRDPQMIMLETAEGTRIDVEVIANCKYGYDIQCEIVCEDGTVSLPAPASVQIRANGMNSSLISSDWQSRFIEAYDVEFQEWVNATLAGRVDGPTAWDGYACAVTATACAQSVVEGRKVDIDLGERPAFYAK